MLAHELDDGDFADKGIRSIAQMAVISALVSLSKTESHIISELLTRYTLTTEMSKSNPLFYPRVLTRFEKASRDGENMAPAWR